MVLIKYFFNSISQFLDSQYDYIYFFYGFSFLFLSLICFNIERNKSYKVPWRIMGLFALTHGIGEWVDLLTITVGPLKVLSVFHLVFLAVSYFFLFEFARIGHVRLKEKFIVRWWIYVPILIMIFVGSQSAVEGLDISIRYFLGLPAGILAAHIICLDARTEKKQKGHLLTFGILLGVYTVLTGLVVKESDFLLAGSLNENAFYDFFGIPVQFVRGFLVFFSAMVLWFYLPAFSYSEDRPFRYRVNLRLSRWTVVWVVIVLIGSGLAFTNFLDYYANIQLIRTSKDLRNSPLGYLRNELSDLEKISMSLSKAPAVKSTLIPELAIEGAQVLLEKTLQKSNLRSCYVVDDKGAVILFTGERLAEKYSPTPYISQLYFLQAFSGQTGYHITPVSGNRERVYSVSYPVKDDNGVIRGFVIVSKVIGVKLLLQFRIMGIVITMFVCVLLIAVFIYLRKRESLIEFMDKVNVKLKEVDQLKTDFISIVSHDLKTPLTAISNAAMILYKSKLKKGFTDGDERELIEIITKNTERQKKMIGDLLDISKIEAGVLPLEIEYHDLVVLAKETIKTFQPQAAEKQIVIDDRLDKDRIIIPMDEEHVRRILGNLLSNAIRYSHNNGRVTVEIKSHNNGVTVSVADQGRGIPKEQQEKIFSKFYRAQDDAARQKGGSGLGLFITKGLVEAHEGKIWLESREGEGATFYFTLPKWHSHFS